VHNLRVCKYILKSGDGGDSAPHQSRLPGKVPFPFSDAVAGFLKIVSEGIQPNDPVVSLKPGELPFRELADGYSQLKAQVVESAQLSAEIPGNISVFQPEFFQPDVGDPSGAKSYDLVDHSVSQALLEALFDSLFQDFSGPGQPQLKGVVTRGALAGGRVRAASGGNFNGADETSPVAFIDAVGGVRVAHFEPLYQLSEWKALEFCAQWVVRRNINEFITFDYSADVQTGSAKEERQFAGCRNGFNGAVSGPLILRQREVFGNVRDVDEVVSYGACLVWSDLPSAQVQTTIYLARSLFPEAFVPSMTTSFCMPKENVGVYWRWTTSAQVRWAGFLGLSFGLKTDSSSFTRSDAFPSDSIGEVYNAF
jgi:hypothetical protein